MSRHGLLGSPEEAPHPVITEKARERYCIIHVWKILNDLSPNDIDLKFLSHSRLGVKITLPPISTKAQASVKTDYENSFKIKAAH